MAAPPVAFRTVRQHKTVLVRGRHGKMKRVSVWQNVKVPLATHAHPRSAASHSAPVSASVVPADDAQIVAQQSGEAHPNSRNYNLLANAYALYDRGVNERIKGNYGLSTDKLTEASKLIDQASSIGRDGRPSTLQAMVFFELGQSAEADGDLSFARDSYVHAVKAKANYVEAYLRLVNVLATDGKLKQAMNWLKDGLRECPNDPRLNAMLTQLGGYMGQQDDLGGVKDDLNEPEPDKPAR